MIHYFPQDIQIELPEDFTNPFRYSPHSLVRTAANIVIKEIEASAYLKGIFSEGKMAGILIVKDKEGNIGYLRGYSGNVGGRNDIDGFVPPIFNLLDPEGAFKKGEQELNELNSLIRQHENDPRLDSLQQQMDSFRQQMEEELNRMKASMSEAKAKREALRKEAVNQTLLDELIKESQFQKAQLHRTKLEWKNRIHDIEQQICSLKTEIANLKRLRAEKSEALQQWIFQQYIVSNACGEHASIADIFKKDGLTPPGGTGECAAPKMLEYAYRHQLQPLAMGEFWVGKSPETAVRTHSLFYPSCTSKCGPLLGYMTKGLKISQAQTTTEEPVIIHEDKQLLAVSKPSGMPSVPGLDGRESLLEWLNAHLGYNVYPVHRIDMDTSGIILFAKEEDSAVSLRKQFEEHSIKKTYRALLMPYTDNDFAISQKLTPGSADTITLGLSPDYDERPRQKVDNINGKEGITEYKVLNILPEGYIDIVYHPVTGRTHQLRVHSAHSLGLGHPIKGDMLYGGGTGSRLCLHAQSISFTHPHSNENITIKSDINAWYNA